jgi:hypothetical protein
MSGLDNPKADTPEIPADSIHEPTSDNPSPSKGLKTFGGQTETDELRNQIKDLAYLYKIDDIVELVRRYSHHQTETDHVHRLPPNVQNIKGMKEGKGVYGRAICTDCGKEFVFERPPLDRAEGQTETDELPNKDFAFERDGFRIPILAIYDQLSPMDKACLTAWAIDYSHHQTEQTIQALLDRTQHYNVKVNPYEVREVEALQRDILETELARLRGQGA